MDKTRHILLFVIFSLMMVLPPGARATTLGDGDYARVGVPDLAQAAAFFHDVLDCRPVGVAPVAVAGASGSRLLSCGGGSMLELFVDRGNSSSRPSQALQFISDDALHTDAWLRQRGVTVSGSPHRLTSGPWAGRVALDFVAPWGLRMQLLGSNVPDSASDGIRATAAVRSHGN